MDISILNFGPIARLRDGLPTGLHPILRTTLGTMAVPPDSPNPTKVLATLGLAIRQYRATLGPLRTQYADLFDQLEALTSAVIGPSLADLTPATQVSGRQSEFPEWKFLMLAEASHDRLLIPAGAEAVFSIIHQQRCRPAHFASLLRDIHKISDQTSDKPLDGEDLANLQFGARWYPHYVRTDKALRKLMLAPMPPAFEGDERAGQRLRNAIVQRAVYSVQKHRAGVSNHRHLSKSQLESVLTVIHQRSDEGDETAVLEAIQVLTGLSAEGVLQIPLARLAGQAWCARIQVVAGFLELNLDSIFPKLRKPPPTSRQNFLAASSTVKSPLPAFLQQALLSRLENKPSARCIGDLLDWPEDSSGACLLPDQAAPIRQTISRARVSLVIDAIARGVPRSMAAAMGWDFGIVPTARAYYLRLDAQSVRVQWCGYLDGIGWTVTPTVQAELEAFGANCVLSHQGVQQVFEHFAQMVHVSAPGRNASLERVINHHNAYASYVGAVLSFCCGLRERTTYDFDARGWQPGLDHALLNDKRKDPSDFDRPVILSTLPRQLINDWQAHCTALSGRIARSAEAVNWQEVTQHLKAIERQDNVALIFHIVRTRPKPIGHAEVWGALPPALATPANAGRSFWISQFQQQGCSSFLLDTFMRHGTQGLETEATSRSVPLHLALSELIRVQDLVIAEMRLPIARGLRSTS